MTKTMILRFRDLGIPSGTTIETHKKICSEYNFVWWGWWQKYGEKIPDTEFRVLNREAQSGLSVYLFDSGNLKLYTANCTEIKWDTMHNKSLSPQKERTPSYYNETDCLAWFKFTKIEEITQEKQIDILKGYTYYKVDEFFEHHDSQYEEFHGKRVFSLRELLYQERTMWFIRKYEQTDKDYEILLYNFKNMYFDDFVKGYIDTTSLNILWLSDLHFSEEFHGFSINEDEFSQKLSKVIQSLLKRDKIEIGGIIVSGDITFKASENEFNLAKSFIDSIMSYTKTKPQQIAICPGNHDIAFQVDLKGEDKGNEACQICDEESQTEESAFFIQMATEEAKKEYVKFYKSMFFKSPNDFLSSGRRIVLGGAKPIEIITLNSSTIQQKPDFFTGHGYIGDNQLQDVAEQMGWDNKLEEEVPIPYRIVVLHHNIIPVSYRERPEVKPNYSILLDAEALTQWVIKHKVKLVLHGHTHQPFYTKITRPLICTETEQKLHSFHILGMGSTGVNISHTGELKCNTLGILTFYKENIKITYFEINENGINREISSFYIPYN